MKKLLLPALVLGISLLLITACKQKEEGKTIAFELTNIDNNVKAQDDFYQYAIGGWLLDNPIPDAYSRWGSFELLYENNLKQLKTILEFSAKSKAVLGSSEQKVGDFYSSGMDSAKIEELGFSPIKPVLDNIDKINNKVELIKISAYLHSHEVSPFFAFFASVDAKNSEMMIARLYQSGMGLPDVEYYYKEDDRSKEIRSKYLEHVTKMFQLINYSETDAKAAAEKIMDIETKLAKSANTLLENRDPNKTYNKLTKEELVSLAPNYDWDLFFNEIGVPNLSEINVGQPKFFKEVSQLMDEIQISDWKAYLKWTLLRNTADYLSSDFVNQDFEFYNKFLSGSKKLQDRWKRVSNILDGTIGELVGQIYVKENFPPEAKTRAKEVVDNLITSMGESIKNNDWMTDQTKEQALVKLNSFGVKIGYPDKWTDYSDLEISNDSFFENVWNSWNFLFNDDIKKIGKPVDKTEWGMTPQTVNAYYSPTRNEIVFPAGILQPPFFNKDADDAMNYGAMGAVIGHEITHGFDDQGRQYDADGNIRDWWTEEDAKRFEERAKGLVDQYNNFMVIDTMKVDGELTLGENIADLGGLTVAYSAFSKTDQFKEGKTIDGFTPQQRFFLSWAQVWRNNIRDENLKLRLKTDVHSPGKQRVNGPFSNMPQFFEAFNVKEGDPMRQNENNIVKIW